MSQRSISTALVLLFAFTAGTTLRAEEITQAQAAAIRQGVQTTLDAYREQAAAGNWDALLRLYADEPQFRWVESGVVVSRSPDEIRKHLTALPAGTRIENTFQETEILPVAGGVAEVVTLFQTRLVDAHGGGYSFGGAMTMTFVQRGNAWKILTGHASSPARHPISPARNSTLLNESLRRYPPDRGGAGLSLKGARSSASPCSPCWLPPSTGPNYLLFRK